MRNPLIPTKPVKITLDTLPQLFAHNRARFGGWSMTAGIPEPDPANDPGGDPPAPVRPEDIPEETWNALGGPGKQAITRERERANAAERALAAARAKPAPPKKEQAKPEPAKPTGGDQADVAAIVQQAVEAALKPFQEAEQQRLAVSAAEKVQTAVIEAAKPRLHDATDALAGIDLTAVVNDQGVADPAKIKAALDDLVTRKPHLAKVGQQRQAPPGIGGGAPAGATDAEKVKAVLADMQRATGVRISTPAGGAA